mgnify:CR=1 FL=1
MVVVVVAAVVVVFFICNHFPFWIWIGRRHCCIWRRVANLRPGVTAGMKGVGGHCGDGIYDVFSLLEFSSLSTAVDMFLVSCSL